MMTGMTNWLTRRRRSFRLSLEAVLGVSTACALIWYVGHASTARRALPWTAKDVREHYWNGESAAHLDYILRAKISREAFDQYAKRLGFSDSPESNCNQQGVDERLLIDAPWWTPSPTSFPLFVKRSEDERLVERLLYDDGYVYYSASVRE
jgi:hypothetical protein